ncbi:MAG: response regulator [Verrucomicrobia bacterium]|nr:response regulator [Verrucomicrobiota bacterium]
MHSASDLLRFLVAWRLDVLALFVVAAVGALGCRRWLRRQAAGVDQPTAGFAIAFLLLLVGGFAAEAATRMLTSAASLGTEAHLLCRLVVLGSAAFAAGLTAWTSTRLALLRAQLRRQGLLEQELQAAKLASDEASRAKSDFLAVVSHEIRTPLNAVMGFARLLADTRLDSVQRGYLTTISSEGDRLAGLINDILDLTRIESGQLALERVPFSPADIAHEVLKLFSARATEARLELRFEAQLADPLLVTGDPARFRQLLVNLIDNALKFTPAGSVTLFLTWTAPRNRDPHGRLTARVRDTGIGIPPEKQGKIFQLFSQADSSSNRSYGGAGLGLAICQRLVKLMDGEITFTSVRGQGSEFRFSLPLAPLELAAAPACLAPEPSFARPPRVLVVDDLETNRFLLEVFLRRHGFEPELARGGEEAVQLAGARHYDAILMDLQMPEVDGYLATARIRAAEPPGRRTPIIALTASLAKGTREKCLAAGMDEHLTKPIDLPKFRRFLHSMLEAPVAAG